MKYYCLLLILFFGTLNCDAQESTYKIIGRVVDSTTQQPLTGASAFCPNTSYGAVCNNDGWFKFNVSAGGYDLVISYTGYERKVIRIRAQQEVPDTLFVSLTKEQKSLETVAVIATNEVMNGWDQYGKLFLENFIGKSLNATHCKLLNPQNLHFYFSKKKNRLKVTAKDPLQIRNDALGYDIRYQLDSFNFEFNGAISQYAGYAFFKEIDTSATVQNEYHRNRIRTYMGSRLHFMRTLYDSTVKEEGFIVEKVTGNTTSGKGIELKAIYDSTLYVRDSADDVTIGWEGLYRIHYTLVPPHPTFLQQHQLPATTPYQTTLIFVNDNFGIEANGYFYEELDVINKGGYWAWKKIAELLPYDYDPNLE